MNSLEYINDRIEMLKIAKESALKIIKEFDGLVPMDAYKKSVKQHEEDIQVLQQIKTELEAWEVVQEEIKIKQQDGYYYIKTRYEKGLINKEQYETIQKALEVKE